MIVAGLARVLYGEKGIGPQPSIGRDLRLLLLKDFILEGCFPKIYQDSLLYCLPALFIEIWLRFTLLKNVTFVCTWWPILLVSYVNRYHQAPNSA